MRDLFERIRAKVTVSVVLLRLPCRVPPCSRANLRPWAGGHHLQ